MDATKWLFNHHAFLEQECKNFVKLHEKQLLRNAEDMDAIVKCVKNVEDRCVPMSADVCEKHHTQLQARVLVCRQMCERMLARRSEAKVEAASVPGPDQKLVKSLEERAKAINEEYDKKEQELKVLYVHMRESLKA